MFIVVGDVVLAVVMSLRWIRYNLFQPLPLTITTSSKLHQVDPKVRIMYAAARSGLDGLACGCSI